MKKILGIIGAVLLIAFSSTRVKGADSIVSSPEMVQIAIDRSTLDSLNPEDLLLKATPEELGSYLELIASVRSRSNNQSLYSELEDLILSVIAPHSAKSTHAESAEEDVQEAMLASLLDDPDSILSMTASEKNQLLQQIQEIQQKYDDPQRLKGLEEFILESLLAEQPVKKEKTEEQLLKDKQTEGFVQYLTTVPFQIRYTTLQRLQPEIAKDTINYMWEKGMANKDKFSAVYHHLLYNIQSDTKQADTNNLKTFKNNEELFKISLPGHTTLEAHIIDMGTIKVDGKPLIRKQRGKDCGFHAAFNGLEIYRFAQGLIDEKKLEEVLPKFDVNEWKKNAAYTCGGETHIQSSAIDVILKDHGLTEKDYSIIESIQTYGFNTDIVPKLVIGLFDPSIKHFSHIMIINNEKRDHWTATVINKTDDRIRIYTTDSLLGDVEAANMKKILTLVAKIKATSPELESLFSINRSLENIRIMSNQRASRIGHLLYILHTLYHKNVAAHPYFIKNFQKPIQEYLKEQLTGKPYYEHYLDELKLKVGGVPIPPVKPATGIVKEMLELLKKVVQTKELAPLPKVDFDKSYNTEYEKLGFLLLLDMYRIQNKLTPLLSTLEPAQINMIKNEIAVTRSILENPKAFTDLENVIKSSKEKDLNTPKNDRAPFF